MWWSTLILWHQQQFLHEKWKRKVNPPIQFVAWHELLLTIITYRTFYTYCTVYICILFLVILKMLTCCVFVSPFSDLVLVLTVVTSSSSSLSLSSSDWSGETDMVTSNGSCLLCDEAADGVMVSSSCEHDSTGLKLVFHTITWNKWN